MQKLRALKRHPYAHETREVGAEYEAGDRDARLLIAVGKAELAEEGSKTPEKSADEKPKRRYKRKDMKAEGE